MLVDISNVDETLLNANNICFLFGAESLLIQQSKDKILQHLSQLGFENKFVFDIDARFNFAPLKDELVAGDLFASKKIIQLNISNLSAKITKELSAISQNITSDVFVLMIAGKLTPAQQKAKWFEGIRSSGITIHHPEIYHNQMQKWVENEMRKLGLEQNKKIAEIITYNSTGNVLSANNELQKLKFVYGSNPIDTEEFIAGSKQQSIYSPYSLIDNALLGKTQEVYNIYKSLKIEPSYLVSLLLIQVRQLIDIHLKMKQKIPHATALKEAGVWQAKTAVVNSALKKHSYPVLQKIVLKLGRIERSIKGMDNQKIDNGLLSILLELSGVRNGIN